PATMCWPQRRSPCSAWARRCSDERRDSMDDERRRDTGDGLMPGDPDRGALVESMIRVDHAGEYGAVRIYEGQLAVLRGTPAEVAIREMADQERRHLE